ncbi:hypothetical protein ACMD2_18029 [Ananas comosus]|nr:hypothetical protein ACMD2_18029 [Ananas comosus]
MSLDFIRNTTTASDASVEPRSIFRHKDSSLPSRSAASEVATVVNCECCGLAEECTRSYVARVRSGFCGRWVCGLCSEAVAEELRRHVVKEEALRAHMEVCRRFSKVAANPAVALVGTMVEILRRESNKKL